MFWYLKGCTKVLETRWFQYYHCIILWFWNKLAEKLPARPCIVSNTVRLLLKCPWKCVTHFFFFRERIERQYMCVPTKNVSFLHSVALYEIHELWKLKIWKWFPVAMTSRVIGLFLSEKLHQFYFFQKVRILGSYTFQIMVSAFNHVTNSTTDNQIFNISGNTGNLLWNHFKNCHWVTFLCILQDCY